MNRVYSTIAAIAFVVVSAQAQAPRRTNSSPLRGCENLLVQGNFRNGLNGWKVNDFYGAKTEALTENGNTFVRFSHDSEKSWSSISQEIASKLKVGKTYLFRIRYRIETDQSIGIRFGDSSTMTHSSALNEKYGSYRRIIGAKGWREDIFEFVAAETHPKADEPMFVIYFDYSNIGEIFVDDVMLAESKIGCQAPRLNALASVTRPPDPPPAAPKTLSRATAADIIKRESGYRTAYSQDVPVGRFWVNSLSLDSYYLKGHNIQPLEESEILTFGQTGKKYVLWVECLSQLTPKGEDAAKTWTRGTDDELFSSLYGPAIYGLPGKPEGVLFHIPLAVKELVAVTGIVFDPSHTRAQVEFTWKWVPTANAKFMLNKVPSDGIQSHAALCSLYDDGWRCSWRNY